MAGDRSTPDEDVHVHVGDGVVTISGERGLAEEVSDVHYLGGSSAATGASSAASRSRRESTRLR